MAEVTDECIDRYLQGRATPRPTEGKGNSIVKINLPTYDGSPLQWYTWIDLFKALIQDTNISAAEKLAVIKGQLRGRCALAVQSVGGGENAYKEAL